MVILDYDLKPLWVEKNLEVVSFLINTNLQCISNWLDLESKCIVTTKKMIEEIKPAIDSCNRLISLAELCIKTLDQHLPHNTIHKYETQILKNRMRISEVTKLVIGE